MAYRKTAKVLAHLAARKALILGAAEDVIARHGLEGLDTARVAARANVAVGAVYKHFPDKHEIFAAIVARALARDVASISNGIGDHYPINALARAIAVLYASFESPRVVRALAADPSYNTAVRDGLAKLIRPVAPEMTPLARKIAAAAVLGVLFGTFDSMGQSRGAGKAARVFVLRGLGVPQAAAEHLTA